MTWWLTRPHPRPPVADTLPRVLAVAVAAALLLATISAFLVLIGATTTRVPAARSALQLIALSAAWLLVNSPVEGRVLLEVVPRHGFTQADLGAVLPLALAVAQGALALRS